jgi:hypothetical protein
VAAKAKLPWASDPRVTVDLAVEPEPIERYPVVLPPPHRSFAAAGVLFGVMFALAGIGLIALAETTGWEAVGGLGIGSIVIGCICFFSSVKRWLAERKIGVVKLWIETAGAGGYRDAAVTDGALRCFVELRETRRLRRMEAELSVTERAERTEGSNRVVDRSVLYTEVGPLETVGRPGLFCALLPLPRPGSVPYAFRTANNGIDWKVEARVELEGWPDWKGELELTVLPPGIEPARRVLTVPAS